MRRRSRVTVSTSVLLLALGLAAAFPATGAERLQGDSVTYTRDVAPILYANCLTCHRDGEVAPMSLRTYDETRPWAKSIKAKVANREMPPWFANPAYGKFKNDARLTEDEIETIVRWVDLGAPRGNPADLPPQPEFPDGWQMGEPDHVLKLPEVTVPAEGPDYFPDLSVTVDIPEDRWVRAVEIRPSNREVAHHVVLFMRDGSGRRNIGRNFGVLAVWAVGSPPTIFPEGMGRPVRKGQILMTNMHYHPNGTAATDQTEVGLYFGEGEMQREIVSALNGSWMFEIPPNAPNHELTASWYIDQDIKVVSYFPHMHLRGKDMRFTAVYPDGREKVLIDIPNWDFDWQLFYYLEDFVNLPKGTRIDVIAHYDNSANNPDNPDPNRTVTFGVQSTDEMMFGVFEYFTVDSAVPEPMSEEEQISRLVSNLPAEDTYRVDFRFGRETLPSALVLPREGEGAWHVPFNGQIMSVPVSDVVWNGDTFSFTLDLKFGGMSAGFQADGTVSESGVIRGEFETAGTSAFQLSGFEGHRTGTGD